MTFRDNIPPRNTQKPTVPIGVEPLPKDPEARRTAIQDRMAAQGQNVRAQGPRDAQSIIEEGPDAERGGMGRE